MRFLIFAAAMASVSVFSVAKSHRKGPHKHGAAEVGVAFDKEKGKIDFKAASDGVIGFEHAAKSEADKKKQAAALKTLEEKIGAMVAFDPALGCKIVKDEAKIEQNDKHAEVKAVFSVDCEKPVHGSTIAFDFIGVFPALKDVEVLLLVDGVQKELKVEKSGVKAEIK